jgi:uncharacterized protein (UPF0332 family)
LGLAKRLRELADGLDEAELRSALSRSYYSVFHAARALGKADRNKKVSQGNIVDAMSEIDQSLGTLINELRDIRHKADYDETYVEREFGWDIEIFRSEVRRRLDQGAFAYQRILLQLERSKRGK